MGCIKILGIVEIVIILHIVDMGSIDRASWLIQFRLVLNELGGPYDDAGSSASHARGSEQKSQTKSPLHIPCTHYGTSHITQTHSIPSSARYSSIHFRTFLY